MPYQIPCPGCGNVALVRWERVIKGGDMSLEYYCGKCEHTWSVSQTPAKPAAPPPPMRKPRTHVIRPKRSV